MSTIYSFQPYTNPTIPFNPSHFRSLLNSTITNFVSPVCCTYPTFKYEGAEGAEFCVKGVVDPPTAEKGASDGVDSLTGEKYLKNGTLSCYTVVIMLLY